MRAVIVAIVSGVAMAGMSAQAAPLVPNPLGSVIYIPNQEWAPLPNDAPSVASVGAPRPVKLVAGGCGVGTLTIGEAAGAIGTGAVAFRMSGDAGPAAEPSTSRRRS
jgi:hypothetical protein